MGVAANQRVKLGEGFDGNALGFGKADRATPNRGAKTALHGYHSKRMHYSLCIVYKGNPQLHVGGGTNKAFRSV